MYKVSVIVPNYNHARYLELRLESVVGQTYPDFEVIILDDSSTDDSRDIIEKFRAHPKVSSIVYNEKNSGSTFLQWEKGIGMAKGDIIWIAESDDYSDPEFISRMVGIIERNPGVGLAFCASNITDMNNVVSSRNYDYNEQINRQLNDDFVMDGREFCEKYLFFGCVLVNASAVVFKKGNYERISKDFLNFKVSGDWRMWTDICYDTKVAYLNESLNYFRFHTNNVRTNKEIIMNREAILNFLVSFKKTDSEVVKNDLKTVLFKHWCFEFSRDLKNLQFGTSFKFMKAIAKVDKYFYSKLYNHSIKKLFRVT